MRPARVGAPRPLWKPPPAAAAGEEDPPEASAPSGRAGSRKKGAAGVRAWLAVDAAGEARVVEAGKHAVMRRTGLPARDLRILDPLLSYPSTLLGRERAVVVNFEHIKAVVTAHEVLLLNYRDPLVAAFVRELQRRLSPPDQHEQLPGSNDQECGHSSKEEWRNVHDLEEPKLGTASPHHHSGDLSYSGTLCTKPEAVEKGKGEAISRHGPRVLPFEFVALEACLEATCSCLDNEVTTLEKEAYPALDKLTSKISTLNLEHVRQIKSRLVGISGRVQKVRDELEHLLDDDEDMAEMYLTEKLMQQELYEKASHSSLNDHGDAMDKDREDAEILSEGNDAQASNEDALNIEIRGHLSSEPSDFNGDSHISRTCSTSSGKCLDVEELEMLLEAYFIQIDSTLNKLSTLREYVDDTEDYINIMLDDKQNLLLQMGVVLTTATLIVSAFVVLVAIFGMNIHVDLFDEKKSGLPEFLWTVGGGAIGSLFLYVLAVAWCKRRRLLE